jgi:hypothetical protein
MHSATGHYQSSLAQQVLPIKKKKSVKADLAAIAEVKVAPYCVNKAGEKTPKTDLNRLLAASCDCV